MDRLQEPISNRDTVERNQGNPLKYIQHRADEPGTKQPLNLAPKMGVFMMVTSSHAKKLNSFSLTGRC